MYNFTDDVPSESGCIVSTAMHLLIRNLRRLEQIADAPTLHTAPAPEPDDWLYAPNYDHIPNVCCQDLDGARLLRKTKHMSSNLLSNNSFNVSVLRDAAFEVEMDVENRQYAAFTSGTIYTSKGAINYGL